MKNLKNKIFNQMQSGVTTIALVITIILLLIIASITIAVLTGDNGLINRTGDAKYIQEVNDIREELMQKWYALVDETKRDYLSNGVMGERLKEKLKESDDYANVEYVEANETFEIFYKGHDFEIQANREITTNRETAKKEIEKAWDKIKDDSTSNEEKAEQLADEFGVNVSVDNEDDKEVIIIDDYNGYGYKETIDTADGRITIEPIGPEKPAVGDIEIAAQVINDTVTPTVTTDYPDASNIKIFEGRKITYTASIDTTETTGTPTYQWYSSNRKSTVGGIKINGATDATLHIGSGVGGTVTTVDSKYYYCEVTTTVNGKTETKKSSAVQLTVVQVSVAKLEDDEIKVATGEDASTGVDTSNFDGDDVTYQWYKKSDEPGEPDEKLDDQTSSTLTITDATVDDEGDYYVVITETIGEGDNKDTNIITSDTVHVTVLDKVPLEIKEQPEDIDVLEGKTADLTVKIEGNGEITYQWYKNDTDSNLGGTKIDGASGTITDGNPNPTLHIDPVDTDDDAYYYCVINQKYDKDGTDTTVKTDPVKITVGEKVKLTKEPEGKTVNVDDAVTFTVEAEGDGEIKYQWFKNTTNSTDGGTPVTEASTTNSSFNITHATTGNGGWYYVVITQTYNGQTATITTTPVELIVNKLTPTITFNPIEGHAEAKSNKTGTFNVTPSVDGAWTTIASGNIACLTIENPSAGETATANTATTITYKGETATENRIPITIKLTPTNTDKYNEVTAIFYIDRVIVDENPTTIKPVTGLKYGDTTALVTEEDKPAGTIVYYSIGTPLDSSNYSTAGSTSIPTAEGKNAGEHTIYYYIPAIGEYEEEISSVTVTIAKATPTVTLNPSSNQDNVNYNTEKTFTATPDVNGKWTSITSSDTDKVSIVSPSNNTNATANAATTITYKGESATSEATTITIVFTPTDTTNYETVEKTFTITSVNKTTNPTTITPVTGLTYGDTDNLVTVDNNTEGTIYYSVGTPLNGDNYQTSGSTDIPTAENKDAGNHIVYYYIPETDNHKPTSGSVEVNIGKKTPTAEEFSINPTNLTVTYGETGEITITYTGDGTIDVQSSDTDVATVSTNGNTITVTGTGYGTTTITVTASEGDNYLAGTPQTCTVTVTKANMNVTSNNYSGTYDTNPHTITGPTVVTPTSGYEIYYSTTEELTASNYSTKGSTTKPTRTDVGTTTVYWYVKATTDNYKDTKGNNTITLTKQTVNGPTNLEVSTAGNVTWTAPTTDNTTGYEISTDGENWEPATSGIDYYEDITNAGPGEVTVYVKAINNDDTNYESTSDSIISTTVTVLSVTFAPNSIAMGTVSPTSYKVISGAKYTTSNNTLTIKGTVSGTTTKNLVTVTATNKTGYSFNKWSNASGNITDGVEVTINATAAVVANFTANVYTITLNNGGADASTQGTTTIYQKYGAGYYKNSECTTQITTTENNITVPERTGYTFNGYYTEATNGVEYISNTGYLTNNANTENFTANGTLYAHWTANSYTIAYIYNDGVAGEKTPSTGTYDEVVEISNPTRAGYVFTGWTYSNGTTATAKYGTTSTNVATAWSDETTKVKATFFKNLRSTTGTVTFTANWEDTTAPTKPTFTAKYDSDNSTYTSGTWTNRAVYTEITTTEAGSGVKEIQWSKDNGTTWTKLELYKSNGLQQSGTTYTGQEPWTVTNGRNDTIYFRAIDNDGNISEVSDAYIIRYDTAEPTITANPANDTTATKTKSITITTADTGGSSLSSSNSYEYYLSSANNGLNDGEWKTFTSGTPITIGSGITGTRYLFVKRVSDNAGNTSTTNGTSTTISGTTYQMFGSYAFDNTSPVLSTLNVTSPDDNAQYYKVGQEVTIVATYTENTSNQIYGTANKGAINADNAPTLKLKFGTGAERTATFDSTSGKTITYKYTIASNDNGLLTKVSYTGTVYDAAGNSQTDLNGKTLGGKTIIADNTAPVITVNPDSCTKCRTKEVTITVADLYSGLKGTNSYEYYLSSSNTLLSDGQWTSYTSGTPFIIGTDITGDRYLFVRRISDNLDNISTTNGTAKTIDGTTYQMFGKYTFDNTATSVSSIAVTAPNSGTYNIGQTITLVVTFDKEIYGTASQGAVNASNAPELKIKFGTGETRTATFSGSSNGTDEVQ